MPRIVAGAARGRSLAVAPRGTRPTADRAREALFSAVEALLGGPGSLAGVAALDLYAGSGAVGLEALSRGASSVTLVEAAAPAVAVIRANVGAVALPGATVVAQKVERYLAAPAPRRHGFVFADPPYAVSEAAVGGVLAALLDGSWLAAGAVVVLERATRSGEHIWPAGLRPARTRAYGEATLWFATAEDEGVV